MRKTHSFCSFKFIKSNKVIVPGIIEGVSLVTFHQPFFPRVLSYHWRRSFIKEWVIFCLKIVPHIHSFELIIVHHLFFILESIFIWRRKIVIKVWLFLLNKELLHLLQIIHDLEHVSIQVLYIILNLLCMDVLCY